MDRNGSRGRPDVSDEAEHLILLMQLLHRIQGSRRSITSSAVTRRSDRPLIPPASLARLNAASMPIFIWRPASFRAPEEGSTMPKRISRSVTPLMLLSPGGRAAAAGDIPKDGRPDLAGPESGGLGVVAPKECSRLASWRSATLQSICAVATSLRPVATWASNNRVSSARSGAFGLASWMTWLNCVRDHLDATPGDILAGRGGSNDGPDPRREIADDFDIVWRCVRGRGEQGADENDHLGRDFGGDHDNMFIFKVRMFSRSSAWLEILTPRFRPKGAAGSVCESCRAAPDGTLAVDCASNGFDL